MHQLVPIFEGLLRQPFFFAIAFLGISAIVLGTMVIRMRHNRSQTKQRRSHHALKAAPLSVCAHCGAKHRPHHMCLECGYYNGRQVIDLEKAKAERAARMAAKREMIRGERGSAPAPEVKA